MKNTHLVYLLTLSAILHGGCASTRTAAPTSGTEPASTETVPDSGATDTDPAAALPRPAALEHGPCVSAGGADRNGFVTCEDGRVHRPAVIECPSSIVADEGLEVPPDDPDDQCTRNADCTERPHGYCAAEGQLPTRTCHYGCTADADCGAGALCMCDNPVGRCLPASCLSDADCGDKLLCSRYYGIHEMGYGAFACDTTRDECNTDDDCSGPEWYGDSCVLEGDARRCVVGARPVW